MKKKGFLAIAIVITIGCAVFLFIYKQMNTISIETSVAQNGILQEYIEVSGKVELDKKEKVFSKLDGRIKSVFVKEGTDVNTNTKLAECDVEDLNYSIKKAQAAYDNAKATSQDIKNSIKPDQIKQAEAQLEQSNIAVDTASKDLNYKKDILNNIKELYDSESVAEQDVKDAELQVNIAENTLNNANEAYKIASYNLKLLKIGSSASSIQAAEANERQAKLQLEDLKSKLNKIYSFSTINGIVLSKHVDEGATVPSGTLLFEIGDLDTAYIRTDIITDDAANIKIGDKVIITGESLDNKEIQGKINYIAPRAETSISSLGIEQQRIEVRIKFDNNDMKLRPGYAVDLKIVSAEKKDALFVSEKSIFQIDGEYYIFVKENGKAKLIKVEKGLENDDYIEILKGIKKGDIIINEPNNTVKDGITVK